MQLSALKAYMEAATLDCVKISELRQDERHRSSIIQAGTPAVRDPVRQTSNNELEIIDQRPQAAQAMLRIVKAALNHAKKSELKLPPGTRRLIGGISLKSIQAIKNKADEDYKGDIARVVDTVRCTILAGDIDDLQLLSEIFRPCARGLFSPDVDFEVIRYRNEFNRINPEKAGIRRLQVNIKMPEAEGHVGEILIFFGPSAAKYDASRAAYEEERANKKAITRAVLRGQGHETTKKLITNAARAKRVRTQANEEAANFPEVRALVMNQSVYEVDDFPVVVNDDGRTGQRFALVPNPVSGLWETDQRFLDVIERPDAYPDLKVHSSSIHEARVRGEALCLNQLLRKELSAEPT